MRPVLSLLGKNNYSTYNREESWEIPFELISDIEWLGSGAQGAVFSGKLFNEVVAVKKVKDVREVDIKHLRKLNHENIVKFKGVCTVPPVFAIVMEFCAYGPLHEVLKEGSKGMNTIKNRIVIYFHPFCRDTSETLQIQICFFYIFSD